MTGTYLFGGSYDSLANQRLDYDRMAVQLAESDRAARERAAAAAQAQSNFELQQSEEDARQWTANAYNFGQNAQAQKNTEAEMAQRKYQFGEQQKMEARKLTDQEQSEKDALALQTTKQGEATREGDYAKAFNAIQTGAVTKPSDLDSYPNLTSVDRQQLVQQIAATTTNAFKAYQGQEQVAAIANGAVQQKRITTPAAPAKGPAWYTFGMGSGTPASAAVMSDWSADEANQQLERSGKSVSQIAPHVHWDEQAQRFLPNATMPDGYEHWKQGMIQGKATATAPAAPVVAAVATPPVSGGTNYQFTGTQGTPVTNSVPPTISAPTNMPPVTIGTNGPTAPAPGAFQFGPRATPPVTVGGTPLGGRRMPPAFYQRVNQLEVAGLPPMQALQQALREQAAPANQ